MIVMVILVIEANALCISKMVEVKWIKIATQIFDNRKIRQIEAMPEGDSIIVIWFKLLCLAGTVNDRGGIYITQEVPYTDQMLSVQFNRPIATVQLALHVLEQFGMISVIDDILRISNWEKYQNVDGMDKIREQTRKRVQQHRERQRLECNVTSNATVTECNAIDKEEDKNKNKNKDKDKDIRHKYGSYKNVFLSDEEMEKLQKEFPLDYNDRIERLSEYIASTGKSYKSHLATIRSWSRREKEKPSKPGHPKGRDYSRAAMSDLERRLLEAEMKNG